MAGPVEKGQQRIDHLTTRCEELDVENARLSGVNAVLVADRDAWRTAHLPDPEAEALGGCVRAFDAMRETMRERSASRSSSVAWSSESVVYGSHEEPRPSALRDPVGRVLLALAARYDLEIEATVPKPRVVAGQRLVSCPADIAEQLERMLEASGYGMRR
jgi:hypothetical protein